MKETVEKIKEIISESLGIDLEKVTPEAYFKDDLSASDLEIFDLLAKIENQFNISLSSQSKGIKTVGNLLEVALEKMGEFDSNFSQSSSSHE